MEMPNIPDNIPEKDPEDIKFEDIEEMGLQEGAYMLGQIRAHELATSVDMGQLCAAFGLAPTEPNAGQIIHEVRNKVIRLEQEGRKGSALERLLREATVEDIVPLVSAYTNGFHAALGQLANIVALSYIYEATR